MEVRKYMALKAAGLVHTYRLGNVYVVAEQKYDPDTGALLDPVVNPLDLKGLQEAKTRLEGELANLTQLIADLGAMEPIKPA